MKLKEIRSKSDAELTEAVERLRREAYNLRVQSASGQIDNPARIRDNRRTIARILTVLNERAQTAASAKP